MYSGPNILGRLWTGSGRVDRSGPTIGPPYLLIKLTANPPKPSVGYSVWQSVQFILYHSISVQPIGTTYEWTMDQISIKTPNPKCRLHWCLIELIDWRYSQSCWYFRPLS